MTETQKEFRAFEFGILILFRISDFVLRIYDLLLYMKTKVGDIPVLYKIVLPF
jgi:hypothetical protein